MKINKKAMINDDDNQTDHHNRIAMFCRFGIRLPPAASAQCAFAVCSSFLIDAATTVMMVMMVMMAMMVMMVVKMGCTQIPISTLSHIWVFVRLYGIVFVIIVIIIIIIMIIKSEGVNAQL